MGFSEMVEILQQRHKGVIVLCRNGNFYIAVGKDAIALNKTLSRLVCKFFYINNFYRSDIVNTRLYHFLYI